MIDHSPSSSVAQQAINSDDKFTAKIKHMVEKAEENRLEKSKQYTSRQKLFYMSLSLLLSSSSSYFIWVLLMGGSFVLSLSALFVSCVIPVLLAGWAKAPLKQYHSEFKRSFMPELAKALGKLSYHPTGGIPMKAMIPSGIIPPHAEYKGEDSFKGKFGDTGLIITEGRLSSKKKNAPPVFEGLFVMLTTPKGKFKGHTIITSDHHAIKRYAKTRWKKLQSVPVREGIKAGDFHVFSNNPDEASGLADEDYIELLQKLSTLFDEALISSAFYAGGRVLLMIPSANDMFEPGDIQLPVSTQNHALQCKREVEQILHLVDVLDVYEADSAEPAPSVPAQENPPSRQEPEIQKTVEEEKKELEEGSEDSQKPDQS
jgi:hypothetical protein